MAEKCAGWVFMRGSWVSQEADALINACPKRYNGTQPKNALGFLSVAQNQFYCALVEIYVYLLGF